MAISAGASVVSGFRSSSSPKTRRRRLWLRSVIAAFALLLIRAPLARAQGALTNGGNDAGVIALPAEIDSWTFDAAAGEFIVLTMTDTDNSAAFVPWLRVIRPNGTILSANGVAGATVAEYVIPTAESGTYTVWAASGDSGYDGTGNYTLRLAKSGSFSVPGGDEGGSLTNGGNHNGTIAVGDLDMWSFTAGAGEFIALTMADVNLDAVFTPWIRVVGPNGAVLALNGTYGATVAQYVITPAAAGTYTVIVGSGDGGYDGSGDYTLRLAKSGSFSVPGGDEGGSLTNGGNHGGTITVGDLDMWSFTAGAGEFIALTMADVNLDAVFTPWIRVVGPNGAVLALNGTYGATVAQYVITPAAAGTYTVIVSSGDGGYDGTGNYTVRLAKSGSFSVPGGDEGGSLTNGGNHNGTIAVGDLDMWSFTAGAGEFIALTMADVNLDAVFTPWIRVVGPNGAVLALNGTYGATVAQYVIAPAAAGTYTVIVGSGDGGYDGSGDYTLRLAKSGSFSVPDGDEGGSLTNGGNHAGTIAVGDLDMWSFTAGAGEFIALTMADVNLDAVFTPWIRVVGPNGAVLALNGTYGATVTQYVISPATAGTYTVIVGSADGGYAGAGSYTLRLAKSGAYVVPAGDEGGQVTNGANYAGAIALGDLDMWSFTAAAGDYVTLSVADVNLDPVFTPWIRVIGPNGAVLALNGTYAASVDQYIISPAVSGTYTVVLGSADGGYAGSGSYLLTLAKGPGAFVVPPGDEGGDLTNGVARLGTVSLGDLDLYSFDAATGDAIALSIGEVTGSASFTPWIRLITPTGVAYSSYGAAAAQIPLTTTVGGRYTVIVGTADGGAVGTGDYSLTVVGNHPNFIRSSSFDNGTAGWQFFATPDSSYIVHNVVNGVLEYYRVPPPAGTSNQAVAFQTTNTALPAAAPITADFDLGNTSSVRKRISVLLLEADFSDLFVCTFWLEPNAPLRTYSMKTHTNRAWTNAAIYFYAASAGSNGGAYQLDNVSLRYRPDDPADRTECVDPTVPTPPGGASGPNLLTNGSFDTDSLAPWGLFGQITSQIASGVFEFTRPPGTPSGVVLQYTGQAMTTGMPVTSTFQLGNSSIVRKRVTVLLHNSDFTDLSACTFWLEPGQPLSPYVMRTWATKPWTDATLSVYPATVGLDQWIRLDDVTLQRTPAIVTPGTECIEPGLSAAQLSLEAGTFPP